MEDKLQTTLSIQPNKWKMCSNFVISLFSPTTCRACAKMIIMDELSFKFVENESFRFLCSIVCPKPDLPSRVTKIFQLYLEKKWEVFFSEQFKNGLSYWNLDMIVTTWFIDLELNLHKGIVNFCQVTNHEGQNYWNW